MFTRKGQSGITLLELLVVLGLISLIAGISFPSVVSGLDSLRLRTAADSVVSFMHLGLTFAERRQQTVELTVSRATSTLSYRSVQPGFTRQLTLPDGVAVGRIFPAVPDSPSMPERKFLLYPGASFPRIAIELTNRKGAVRRIRLDPVSGVPVIEAATIGEAEDANR